MKRKRKSKFFMFVSVMILSCWMIEVHPAKTMEGQASDIVEKIYNPEITYSPGIFASHQRGVKTLAVSGNSTTEPYPQSVLVYEDNPQKFEEEMALMRVDSGRDGRRRIDPTNQWPHSAFVQLGINFQNKLYGGSGAFVGPQHVLTCGHNVYGSTLGGWANSITAHPALNDTCAPFGEGKVVKVYTFNEWVKSSNREFDMALLVLDRPLGQYTGWCGLLSSCDDAKLLSHQEIHITGYPGDKGFKQMWTMSHRFTTVLAEQFDYEIDTSSGQSGSPIWIDDWGTPMILGVHTLGNNYRNSGVRLSEEKLKKLLVGKISENYVISSSVLTSLNPIPRFTVAPLPALSGYDEQIYQRFLNGKLIYKPNTDNDSGMVTLLIRDLTNPLGGTFDLSRCGDTGNYLSISTGYRRAKKPENANKIEIWFVPRFLVEMEINGSASHLKAIFPSKWPESAPVGIIWTWGNWDDMGWYDYLTDQDFVLLSNENLYVKWRTPPVHGGTNSTHPIHTSKWLLSAGRAHDPKFRIGF